MPTCRETAAERNNIQIERDNARAELAAIKKQADADRFTKTVQTDIQAQDTVNAAERERKEAKARSPETRELLKYFVEPGYYQPKGQHGYEKLPVSLNALTRYGALQPSEKGLQNLLEIGRDPRDKERPRMGYPGKWQKLNPQQKEELKEIQNLLIELGDVMVEIGLLSP